MTTNRIDDTSDGGRLVAWRRHHGDDLVANVINREDEPLVVFAWHERSHDVRRHPRTFQRLESAKAAADDLVRRSFDHTCTMDSCGEWTIWTA